MTLTLCVILFILSAGVSTVASGHPVQSLMRGAWTPLILAGCLLYALAFEKLSLWVRPTLTALLLILCAASLWQAHTGYHLEAGRIWRAHGFLPHPNDTALAAVLAPLLAPWTWPVAAGLILLSGSRTALVGLAVGLLILTRSWVLRAVVIGTLGIGLVAVVHPAALTALTARVGPWMVAWSMFTGHPWLGWGPQTFFDHYWTMLPGVLPLPFGVEADRSFVPWAHNLYLEVLAERGLVGVLAVGLPLVLAWRRATRPLRAALVAFLVMGVVDLTFLKPWVVAAYWGLVTVSLTGLPTSGFHCFRICDWPAGWTYATQHSGRRNGVGVSLGAWTYFLVWGEGPYLS